MKAPCECDPSVVAYFTLPVDEGKMPFSNAAQYKVPPAILLLPPPLLTSVTDKVILDLVKFVILTADTLGTMTV